MLKRTAAVCPPWSEPQKSQFYNGQSVIEERNNNEFKVTRQYVFGTQYIDQLIQIGVNTDPHAGQLHENDCETFYWTLTDANYNVLGVVDSSGHLTKSLSCESLGVWPRRFESCPPVLICPLILYRPPPPGSGVGVLGAACPKT